MVASHFLGSAGLSLVIGLFIIGQSFWKRSGTDLFFFAISLPMDVWMLTTSFFSVTLWLALTKLRRELRTRRQLMEQHMEESVANLSRPTAADDLGRALQRNAAADAAEQRRVELAAVSNQAAGPQSASEMVLRDLRCPISLEIMTDPVIASDGFSYERASIERWLVGHRTSPLTGRPLPSSTLVPNHRLRHVIQDLSGAMGGVPRRATDGV